MTLKKISLRLLPAAIAACALVGMAAPAAADVRFDFEGRDTGGTRYEFSFTAPEFFAQPGADRDTDVLSQANAFCTVSGMPCSNAVIQFEMEDFSGTPNAFSLSIGAAGSGAQFLFSRLNAGVNILGQAGTFYAECGCDEGSGMLNVSVTAVPEPATWATFTLGAGLVGWSLRRRRSSGSISA